MPGFSQEYNSSSVLKWGNSAASLRWYHVFSDKIFNNVTLAYTKYRYQNNYKYESINSTENLTFTDELNLHSTVNDVVIKTDTEIPLRKCNLKIGGQYSNHFFIPSSITQSQSLNDSVLISPQSETKLNASDASIYGEFLFHIIKNVSVNLGIRSEVYWVNKKEYYSLQPRAIINYQVIHSWAIKASFCKMQQNIHLLTNSNTGLPTDLWLPATNKIKPETSKQFTLGLAHTTPRNYEFSVELYHKKINNLIEYKEGILLFGTAETWEEKIEKNGEGKVNGIEFLFQKKEGRTTGWIGYTLSKNERKFDNIENGNYFPFRYDQRHDFSIVLNYKLTNNIFLSATWVYHSGNAITLPSGKYQLYNMNYSDSYTGDRVVMEDVHIYSEKNGYRMPAYHKLDVGFNYIKKKPKGEATWTLGAINLYNRQNAYYLFLQEKEGVTKLKQQSLFPILVNFGYLYAF
ncbi:MAG: TonB-dependent receptor [Salinivirgaceae bacterium]|nr:TonB-dependent receptor [Salinivirgaceae bacterium]